MTRRELLVQNESQVLADEINSLLRDQKFLSVLYTVAFSQSHRFSRIAINRSNVAAGRRARPRFPYDS
jgi:hypothetical protein